MVALAGLSQISLTTPYWLVLVLHMVLMVSLASAFAPVFTLGLGSLPSHLYSHGSSILGTLQQVAAAFGTALAVTVISVRSDQVIDEVGAVAAHVSSLHSVEVTVVERAYGFCRPRPVRSVDQRYRSRNMKVSSSRVL